jgi:hypothetical protein
VKSVEKLCEYLARTFCKILYAIFTSFFKEEERVNRYFGNGKMFSQATQKPVGGPQAVT